jgi:hypothetical protein
MAESCSPGFILVRVGPILHETQIEFYQFSQTTAHRTKKKIGTQHEMMSIKSAAFIWHILRCGEYATKYEVKLS